MAITTRTDKGSALTHAEMDENFTDFRDNPTGIVFPKTQNTGIKVDNTTPTFPWKTQQSTLLYNPADSNIPVLTTYVTGVLESLYTEGDHTTARFQIPHDYVMGTNIYISAHYSHNSTVVTGGSVTWNFPNIHSKSHDRQNFDANPVKQTSATSTVSTMATRVRDMNTLLATSGGGVDIIDADHIEPDTIILMEVIFDSNDIITSDVSTPGVFLHAVNIQYQSTGVGTKNREPDFWT
jgi:hypothetical protein